MKQNWWGSVVLIFNVIILVSDSIELEFVMLQFAGTSKYMVRQAKWEWSLEWFYGMIYEGNHTIPYVIRKLNLIGIQICA